MKKLLITIVLALVAVVMAAQTGGALLMQAAEACVAGNCSEADIALLRRVANEQGLPAVAAWAQAMADGTLDAGDRLCRAATGELLDRACQQYGDSSMEAVVCRRAALDACDDADRPRSRQLATQNAAFARALLDAHPNDTRAQQLCLVTRLESVMANGWLTTDTPETWQQVFQTERDVLPMLTNIKPTAELVDICTYLAELEGQTTCHDKYVTSLLCFVFEDGRQLPIRTYYTGVQSASDTLHLIAWQTARLLWGDNDSRTLTTELRRLDFLSSHQLAPHDSIASRLHAIRDLLAARQPEGSPVVAAVELCIMRNHANFSTQLEAIGDPAPMLRAASAYYGQDSESYLQTLYILTNLQQSVHLDRALAMSRDVERLAARIYGEDNPAYGVYLLGQLYLHLLEANSQPDSVQSFLDRVERWQLDHHSSAWESINVGIDMAGVYSDILGQPDKSFRFIDLSLNDMPDTTGLPYACLYSQWAEYRSFLGRDGMVPVCQRAIDLLQRHGVVAVTTYATLADCLMEEDPARAVSVLREAAARCVGEEYSLWRCYFTLCAEWFTVANGLGQPDWQQVDGAERFLHDNAAEFALCNLLDSYGLASNLHRSQKQFDRSEELLKEGIAVHEAVLGSTYSSNYVNLLGELYGIYADVYNDYDRANQLLEGRMDELKDNPYFTRHDLLVDMLWTRYRNLAGKADAVARLVALQDIMDEMTRAAQFSNMDEAQRRAYLLPYMYEVAGMMGEFHEAWRNIENTPVPKGTEQLAQEQMAKDREQMAKLNTIMTEQVLPLLNEEEEARQQQDAGYLDHHIQVDLLLAKANIYFTCLNDTAHGEECLLRLANSTHEVNHYRGCAELAGLYLSAGHPDKAEPLLLEQGRLAKRLHGAMEGDADKEHYQKQLYKLYVTSGREAEAVAPAREIFRLRQRLIATNFDLLTESEREEFINSYGAGGEGILLLLHAMPDTLAADAYNAALADKGMLLRASDRIMRYIAQSDDAALRALADSLATMKAELSTIDTRQLEISDQQSEATSHILDLRRRIEATERAINRCVAKAIPSTVTPVWTDVQQRLAKDEAAVELVVADTVTAALVLRPDSLPAYVPLTSTKALTDGLLRLLPLSDRGRAEALYEDDSLHLYRRLWQPLVPHLGGARRVWLSPSGFLNLLAFHAIPMPDGGSLCDSIDLRQVLTTAEVPDRTSARPAPIATCALYGGVSYSPGQGEAPTAVGQRAVDMSDEDVFGYLSHSREEVGALSTLLSQHGVATTLCLADSATEPSVRALDGHSPDMLVLSTHGFFLADDAQVLEARFFDRYPSTRFSSMIRSGLAFAGANDAWRGASADNTSADGILTAAEVASIDLTHTRLAVLSACETARGQISSEGVFGMQRGFRQAGVGSTLATLWTVSDESTSLFMQRFAAALLDGQSMQQAVNTARNDVRRAYPSPYFWAPYVLNTTEP